MIYIYIWATCIHWLISSLDVAHVVTVIWAGAHRLTNLNFLVHSIEYEAPPEWREAGAGMKVI